MTNKDRAIDALNHKETDRVPHQIDFTIPALEIMQAYTGDKNIESKMNMVTNLLFLVSFSSPHINYRRRGRSLETHVYHFTQTAFLKWTRK